MIKEFKCYTLLCDNCGADVNENNEYSGYENIEDSRDYASENDWLKHEGKIYCPKCYSFSYDDVSEQIIIDKTRTTEVKND